MSFILDALRKSERARRALGDTPPDVPLAARARADRVRWWTLAIMIGVVNLIVLGVAWSVWRPGAESPEPVPVTALPLSREVRPLADEAPNLTPTDPVLPTGAAGTDTAMTETPPSLAELPGLAARLPPLHVDVHSYAEDPAQRFVLVNLKRYAEGQRLVEGPMLVAIVPDGLILEWEGARFLLPRR